MAWLADLLAKLLPNFVKLWLDRSDKAREVDISDGSEEMTDDLSKRVEDEYGEDYRDALRRADGRLPDELRRDGSDSGGETR